MMTINTVFQRYRQTDIQTNIPRTGIMHVGYKRDVQIRAKNRKK